MWVYQKQQFYVFSHFTLIKEWIIYYRKLSLYIIDFKIILISPCYYLILFQFFNTDHKFHQIFRFYTYGKLKQVSIYFQRTYKKYLAHFAPTQNAPGSKGSNLNFANVIAASFQKKMITIIDVLSFFFCNCELCWVKQFLWFEVSRKRGATLNIRNSYSYM